MWWIFAFTIYVIALIVYYIYHRIFPYREELIYLAFFDLTFLILVEIKAGFNYEFSLTLRYIQIILFFWALYQSSFTKVKLRIFGILYLFLCIGSFFLCYKKDIYFLCSHVFLFIIILLIMMVIERDFSHQLSDERYVAVRNDKDFSSQLSLQYHYYKKQQDILHILFKIIAQYFHLIQEFENNSFERDAFILALEKRLHVLFSLERVIVKYRAKTSLYKEDNNLDQLLYKIFQETLILKKGNEKQKRIKNSDIKIQLHYMDKYIDKENIPDTLLWNWIIFSWFHYLLSSEIDSVCKVIITSGNEYIYLKGVVRLHIIEIEPQNQYVTCPICNGRFRYLYKKAYSSMGRCAECLKKKHLENIESDWGIQKQAISI